MQHYTETTKNDRLQIRVDRHSKALLQKASEYSHTKVSDFVLSFALEAAEEIISQYENTALSPTDWSLFYKALLKPRKPNAKLKKAMRKYKMQTGQ